MRALASSTSWRKPFLSLMPCLALDSCGPSVYLRLRDRSGDDAPRTGGHMAIIRIYTGPDGKSHFEEIEPKLTPRGDQSDSGELIPGSGIVVRKFDPKRSNP